jgi:hypothetical protein
LQLFAPLEIYVPGSHKIERDYSPVWSVWRSEHNAVTGASSRSLLWNFYRHDKTTNSAFTSAVFGLYQSRKTNAGTSLKFFYVPVKKSG